VRLNRIRNRVAHHEPLLNVGLIQRVADAVALIALLDPDLSAHLAAFSTVAQHVKRRP
jgi:hypothetical protein